MFRTYKSFSPLFGFAILFLISIIGLTIAQYTNPQTHTNCVVESKDRTATKRGSDMRVYTSCGVFSVKDMLLSGDFTSADTYARISPGQTYTFGTTGYRIPIISTFPVIREVH